MSTRPRADRPFNQRTQAVERASQVLDLFSLARPELSLTDVCHEMAIPAATAHRLLKTMEEARLLVRVDGSERYRLGPKLLMLSTRLLLQHPIRDVAAPFLRRLSDQLGQTVGLARYDDGYVVYLDCVEAPGPISIALRPGWRAPAHCVASGRSLLAYLEPTELERLAARGLTPCPRGDQDAISLEDLRRELAAVRQRGYATDDGVWRPGVRAAAAPILDAAERPIAAITAVGFEPDLSLEQVHAAGRAVRDVCEEIHRALGAPG